MRTTLTRVVVAGPGDGEYLSRKEVARKFGVTDRTIDNWRKKFGLPHYRLGGRVRFKPSDMDAWMKTFRRGGPMGAVGESVN